MEGDRRIQFILMGTAVAIFVFSYSLGYFIGKEAGFEEAKQKFDIEKQKLLKTIAALSPVSQPRVENKVVVVDNTKEKTEHSVAEEKVKKEISQEKKKIVEEKKKELASTSTKQEKKSTVKLKSKETTREIKEKGYYLQVGVFKNKTNAIKLASQLKEKGFNSKTLFYDKYTVVTVGYFDSKEKALSVQKLLKNIGYKSILKRRK
ncbi:Sporulation domain-containing protein [Desulfurobacterium thermolithotrophum DSM 11699]|uniref:Sporulation domain-containing protein n=1 Tax=Desulfurobacterium thermolithotrophum (strain DSM 11699 / BSA) TaxID=868864 RepID=F0S049_DESTD|nr:SPOR domain-containing protein [Desulfurobacterium thermolithotrophum]ADY73730.1 Sporulation domain-containing protein [Desulfurobacterium thermolithotrophum DSM 11699]